MIAAALRAFRTCLYRDPSYVDNAAAPEPGRYGPPPPGLDAKGVVAERLATSQGELYRYREAPGSHYVACGIAVYGVPADKIGRALDGLLGNPHYGFSRGKHAVSWDSTGGKEVYWGNPLGMDGLRIVVRPPAPNKPSLEVDYERVFPD